MSDFYPSPTMERFMRSDAYVRVLAGPIGGGKSVCCAHELVRWATTQAPNAQNIRKTRFLVVRNTLDQLRSTTYKTIVDWFPIGTYGTYRATEKVITYRFNLADGTTVESEWMFIAMDEPDSVRKALSLECTGVWGNECRELRPEIADALLMRVNRYPSMKDGGATRAGAIFDTNMPGQDSWWGDRLSEPPDNWEVFIQPPAVVTSEDYVEEYNEEPPVEMRGGDNVIYTINPNADNLANLAYDYYPNVLIGKSADFIGVYLQCKLGRSLSGLPVYDKTFRYDKHVSPVSLAPIRSDNYPLCIGLDFGRSPAAIICQLTPKGQINVLSEVLGENMGIQTFTTTLLRPHLFEKYPGLPCYIAPDPAGWQRTQLVDMSPVDYLKKAGYSIARPPTNSPKLRIEAVDAVLGAAVDASPRLQINKGCTELIKGFRGGYKWRLNKLGDLADEVSPMKDHYSHCVAEGTLVGTRSGSIPIESIKVGDYVSTPVGERRVLATMWREVEDIVSIELSNGTALLCTGDHPVQSLKGLVQAETLQKGDLVVVKSVESGVPISSVVDISGSYRVYDLTVEEDHRFFANGVLVGNCHDAFQYAILVIDGHPHGVKKSSFREIAPIISVGWT